MSDSVQSTRASTENVARFIAEQLRPHGKITEVAAALDVQPGKVALYARAGKTNSQIRDIGFVYMMLLVLDFDPVTVFSAAQRSDRLGMMNALAEGHIRHTLSPALQTMVVTSDSDKLRGRAIAVQTRDPLRDGLSQNG